MALGTTLDKRLANLAYVDRTKKPACDPDLFDRRLKRKAVHQRAEHSHLVSSRTVYAAGFTEDLTSEEVASSADDCDFVLVNLFHQPFGESDWAYRRLEASARSMCDGISVWTREMQRPESERSPTVLAHEVARMQRMADFFEARVADPLLQGAPGMAHLILAVALDVARKRGPGDLADGRPQLAAWMRRMSALPSVRATALP